MVLSCSRVLSCYDSSPVAEPPPALPKGSALQMDHYTDHLLLNIAGPRKETVRSSHVLERGPVTTRPKCIFMRCLPRSAGATGPDHFGQGQSRRQTLRFAGCQVPSVVSAGATRPDHFWQGQAGRQALRFAGCQVLSLQGSKANLLKPWPLNRCHFLGLQGQEGRRQRIQRRADRPGSRRRLAQKHKGHPRRRGPAGSRA